MNVSLSTGSKKKVFHLAGCPYEKRIRYTNREEVSRSEAVLSPETAQFLEMIDHTGSIQSACGCMHMSYSRGWRTLNHMEQELGYPLVERFPGGSSGGGSALTNEGRRLLHAYQQYQESLRHVAEELFRELFPEDLRK